jgi:hypothetical protein
VKPSPHPNADPRTLDDAGNDSLDVLGRIHKPQPYIERPTPLLSPILHLSCRKQDVRDSVHRAR